MDFQCALRCTDGWSNNFPAVPISTVYFRKHNSLHTF